MDFRQRLEQNRERPVTGESLSEPQDDFRSEYFATDNIRSLPACLDLRLPNGIRKALPYSYFTEINFDSDEGIEILTNSKKIKIIGRNLTKLFDYLVTYRVRYIMANIGNDQKEEGLFVKEIKIEELNF
jgi:hypothetical protein